MIGRVHIALAVLLWAGCFAAAHETNQYVMPVGRETTDLGDHFTRWIYEAIDGGVNEANDRIRAAVDARRSPEQIKALQSDDQIAHAINREFPYAISLIHNLDGQMASRQMKDRYPGTLPGHKPPPTLQQIMAFPTNPFRAWGCASINVFGVQLGTDKIGHFTDMGMHYYQTYKGYLDKGESEQQAMQRALDVGTKDPLKSEAALLGYWTAGAYSNADLAVNHVGFIFYRNLTEPQMLKGKIRPPMLLRDGQYWKIAPHVRPDSDFFTWFISEHLDESLNPSLYLPPLRETIRSMAEQNAAGVLEHRRDRWGNRRSQAWLVNRSLALRTYWGVNYGHDGDESNLILIEQVSFPPPKDSAARDSVGRSPLHRAVAFADLPLVEQLLERGADVNLAVRSDEPYNSNWGDTPLHMAVQDGREQIVRLLIARRADVNRANDRGNTPLHRAVEYANLVSILLDAGAKVDAADSQGRTPLHWAAMGAGSVSMSLLLEHGANVNARDNQGQTPLHYAARFGDAAAIVALLAKGGDANAVDNFGATALHVAAAAKQPSAAEAMLKNGALANAKDVFGCTPLHDAARQGSDSVVALLIGAGADKSAADFYGATPLHLACRNGNDAAAIRLIKAGANVAVRSANRGTPIDEARRGGYVELASRLQAAKN